MFFDERVALAINVVKKPYLKKNKRHSLLQSNNQKQNPQFEKVRAKYQILKLRFYRVQPCEKVIIVLKVNRESNNQ